MKTSNFENIPSHFSWIWPSSQSMSNTSAKNCLLMNQPFITHQGHKTWAKSFWNLNSGSANLRKYGPWEENCPREALEEHLRPDLPISPQKHVQARGIPQIQGFNCKNCRRSFMLGIKLPYIINSQLVLGGYPTAHA